MDASATAVLDLQHFLLKRDDSVSPDLDPKGMTAAITCLVESFAETKGWRTQREYRLGVVPHETRRRSTGGRTALIDLALFGPWGKPLLIELDRTNNRKSLDKLKVGVAWGYPAVWLRWGGARMEVSEVVPAGIHLITLVIPGAKGWDANRKRTYDWLRVPLQDHEIPSPMTVTFVDPDSLMTPVQRALRDDRVAERRRRRDERRAQRRARRKAEGWTRGSPVNPTSKTSAKPATGWEFPTGWDGRQREQHAKDLENERAELDKRVTEERRERE